MAPVFGNSNNNKFYKYPEECKKAFKSYLEWIELGNSPETWRYKSDTMTLTKRSIDNYMREYPTDFPPQDKEAALAVSQKVWEERGLAMMLGQIDKCQPAIFQMFMRNKFGWDRETAVQKDSKAPLLERLTSNWRGKGE